MDKISSFLNVNKNIIKRIIKIHKLIIQDKHQTTFILKLNLSETSSKEEPNKYLFKIS